MARKLRNPGHVTLAEFARKLNVSGQAVSQAVQSGRLRAFDSHGELVPANYPGRKWLDPALAAEDWRYRRRRIDDAATDADGDLVAARVRAASLQVELLEIRIAKQRGELIPRADALAAAQAAGRAVQRAFKGGVAWSEELGAAFQQNGLAGLAACLRGKLFELNNTLADLIAAEAAQYEPPDKKDD